MEIGSPPDRKPGDGGNTKPVILVVDDEENVRKSLERLLRKPGYRIVQAASVAEGKTRLSETPVDLVVCDLRMPGEDGIELLRHAFKHYPDTARIMLTGHADLDPILRAVNEGYCNQILTKPWEEKPLLQAVFEQVERVRLKHRNTELSAVNDEQNQRLKRLNKQLEERVRERTEQLRRSLASIKANNRALVQSYRSTVRLLLELSSMNPGVDNALAQRTSELGATLAKALEMDVRTVSTIRYACQLHELGKLALPQEIATAAEVALDKEDWATYQTYPEQGSLALTSVDYLSGVAELIARHREHWDGSGFPRGLEGEEIPQGSQIIRLCRDYALAMRKYQDRKNTIGRRAGDMNVQMEALGDIEVHADKRYSAALVELLKNSLAVDEIEVDEDEVSKQGVMVSARTLEAGMTLAQDVYTSQDLLMLTKGQVLTERHIEKLLSMEREYQRDLSIYVEPN